MRVLELTEDARQLHGIRHQDYKRYRKFCSKKIQSTHSLIFKAERAFYYSVELIQLQDQEYRKKQHSNKRLKRAVQLSLAAIDDSDDLSRLETTGYHLFIKSQYHVQLQDYENALESFKMCK